MQNANLPKFAPEKEETRKTTAKHEKTEFDSGMKIPDFAENFDEDFDTDETEDEPDSETEEQENDFPSEISNKKKKSDKDGILTGGGKVNPKYNPMIKNSYSKNCQSSVIIHETRSRGYDVEFKLGDNNEIIEKLKRYPNIAFFVPNTKKHPDFYEVKAENEQECADLLDKKIKYGERYILHLIGKHVGRLYQADKIIYNLKMNYKRLYVPNSCVFLTLVTENRIPVLLNNTDIIKQSFIATIKLYKYKLIAYTIQNDHIHCIIKPKEINDYSKIIKSFKYSFTKKIKQLKNNSVGLVKPTYNNKIWQNRFWEHTIRDENDLYKHLDYIHYNFVKHNKIMPKNWLYSSFRKYVKYGFYDNDWYNCNDVNNIKNLNFE